MAQVRQLDAWRLSAGNTGRDCLTAQSPGDYPNVISVGATDIDDQIAIFSSRGRSLFGGQHESHAFGAGAPQLCPSGGRAAGPPFLRGAQASQVSKAGLRDRAAPTSIEVAAQLSLG